MSTVDFTIYRQKRTFFFVQIHIIDELVMYSNNKYVTYHVDE